MEYCNILSISERIRYFILLDLFKYLSASHPILSILSNYEFSGKNRSTSYTNTRLRMSFVRTTQQKKCVTHRSIKLWNELPNELRDHTMGIVKFRSKLTETLIKERANYYI